ncbi:VOC family protein [Luteimonas sp. 3794]|uniref:VOC family protein n=1 Tax=Luteimonas sp. 3794 TaxID=2817730 RepID=UPI00285AE211|nr:VOC family protein [Luteimonas sp. 3794]MDR6991971.1 putative enzyme related to lactoylglutathione lyase [Luteimonas sp. 3794]
MRDDAGINGTPSSAIALSYACRRLKRAYLLHAFWFMTMCGFAWLHRDGPGLKIAVLLALLTVPPVLVCASRVHRLCRAIDPRAGTIGLAPMLVMTVVFTPFESGLIVPAKNWWVARRLLRRFAAAHEAFAASGPAQCGMILGPQPEPMSMPAHAKLDYVEFPARDLDATKRFFAQAFDWTFEDYGPDYVAFANQGLDGGFYRADLQARSEAGSALLVFYSARIEETLAKVEAAGGTILKPVFEFPGGRRFHFAEPSGNEFAVWSDPAD